MEKTDIFELHADLCKTLSNPKRLMILALLAKKEMSVGEIAEVIAVPPLEREPAPGAAEGAESRADPKGGTDRLLQSLRPSGSSRRAR